MLIVIEVTTRRYIRSPTVLNSLLYLAAAWTQLSTQLSSSFITVHSVLVLQKLPDTTGDPTRMDNYIFRQDRLSIPFTKKGNSYFLTVIAPQALEKKRIKSGKSGLVSLGREEECGCWIRIKPASSGK